MNVRLLRRVQKNILEEPRRFDMSHWAVASSVAPCGTTACIAGWACILTERKPKEHALSVVKRLRIGMFGVSHPQAYPTRLRAKELIDIPDGRGLFFVDLWPEKYRTRYLEARTARMRARVAVQRIDHFIKTKGME